MTARRYPSHGLPGPSWEEIDAQIAAEEAAELAAKRGADVPAALRPRRPDAPKTMAPKTMAPCSERDVLYALLVPVLRLVRDDGLVILDRLDTDEIRRRALATLREVAR